MTTAERFNDLFHQYLDKSLTAAGRQELMTIIRSGEMDEALRSLIHTTWDSLPLEMQSREEADAVIRHIFREQSTRVHRIHFLRTAWFRYAAAIILLAGIGGYLLWSHRGEIPAGGGNDKEGIVKSGTFSNNNNNNKTILTLASGKKIELDNNNNKTPLLVKEGPVFDPSEAGQKPGVASYNTITTPKGGQYQLILPDGTKAWLNAASSIKFPTTFTGNQRKIETTGEIYLEVAVNKIAPFIVTTKETEIQVLGTSFNINSYEDESTIKTTLVEGSIKVKTNKDEAILKPGQQAKINRTIHYPENLKVLIQPTDVNQQIAWKNGIFNFEGLSLKEVMNQLRRWYDIEVIYESGIPDITFFGEMGKNEKLPVALEMLKSVGVHFRMEGKRLIITQ